jgi:hypothetical protein
MIDPSEFYGNIEGDYDREWLSLDVGVKWCGMWTKQLIYGEHRTVILTAS